MASISCSSSVSAQKSPEIRSDNRSKSCDTVCSSSSSCFFKRRKPMNPLAYSLRPTYHKTNTNSVKQRVMSAKMLKLRQLQSQLNDANFHLAEVARENQTLKTLQKRQDKALSSYENANADLPRLLHSHQEEIKVLTEKNKNLRKTVKELSEQLKQKEDELNKAREQLSHLEKLNKDKHLSERGKLMEQMEDLKINLHKSDEQVTTLNRKLMLETKISKQRLNSEILKHKQCQKELLHAFDEIDRLSGLLDVKENMVRPRNPKFNKLQNRDSMSMITLRHYQTPNRNMSNDRLSTLKDSLHTPVTEVRLEPLVYGYKKDSETVARRSQDGFKAPMDNIKHRLSSGSKAVPHDLNGLSAHNSDIYLESRDNSASSLRSRPNSSLRLPVVQENQRVRGKMKRENENGRNETISKEKIEEDESGEEKLELDQNEKAEINKEINVRFDSEAENNNPELEELIRKQVNEKFKNTAEKRPKLTNLSKKTENQLGNDLHEDLEDIIEKMKMEKREEIKVIHKPPNDRKKNSDDNPKTENPLGENDSDEDLEVIIQKMKKEKHEGLKGLHKPPNNARKNSEDNSKTNEVESQKSEEENIEKITETLDRAIQRATENSKEEFDKKLGTYCSEVLTNVKNCSKAIKVHKDSLENSKKDTNTLLESLKRTEKVESKLKKSFFSMDDDMDFVNDILHEEYKFQSENMANSAFLDKNSNIENKSLVNLDNKKKLLATLRAIDNGDSVDSVEERKQGNFINERFGHVAH